jgi:hypothetical protein
MSAHPPILGFSEDEIVKAVKFYAEFVLWGDWKFSNWDWVNEHYPEYTMDKIDACDHCTKFNYYYHRYNHEMRGELLSFLDNTKLCAESFRFTNIHDLFCKETGKEFPLSPRACFKLCMRLGTNRIPTNSQLVQFLVMSKKKQIEMLNSPVKKPDGNKEEAKAGCDCGVFHKNECTQQWYKVE